MEQVAQYVAGERDYANIKGGTGPLVYPGAHVYVYRALYALTDEGRDIRLAQMLFAGLYVAVLLVVMACYRLAKVSWNSIRLILFPSPRVSFSYAYLASYQWWPCKVLSSFLITLCFFPSVIIHSCLLHTPRHEADATNSKVPPYIYPMLILSKRLHSIFVLRCFNDCFAVGAFFLATYAYQKRMWTLGSICYSLAVGIKMSALLALPAVGLILLQAIGKERAITQAGIIGYLQVTIPLPPTPNKKSNIDMPSSSSASPSSKPTPAPTSPAPSSSPASSSTNGPSTGASCRSPPSSPSPSRSACSACTSPSSPPSP